MIEFMDIRFMTPQYAIVSIVGAILWWMHFWNVGNKSTVTLSKSLRGNVKYSTRRLIVAVMAVILFWAPLTYLMSTPHRVSSVETQKEVIDIMFVVDVSGSMKSTYKGKSKISIASKSIQSYVKRHPNNRYGLVLFARDSVGVIPLTHDFKMLIEYVRNEKMMSIPGVGSQTAITDAIILAVNRMVETMSKTRHIVLITDGAVNSGIASVEQALEVANDHDVKIISILVDNTGRHKRYSKKNILQKLSEGSDGKYFVSKADNEIISDLIQKADKTVVKIKKTYHYSFSDEKMFYVLGISFLVLCLMRMYYLKEHL